jgi:hypothetical protein
MRRNQQQAERWHSRQLIGQKRPWSWHNHNQRIKIVGEAAQHRGLGTNTRQVKKGDEKIRSQRRTSLGNKYWRGGEDVLEPRRQAW